MTMHVYINGRLAITETNVAYALPYWSERKQARARDGVRITWTMTTKEST